MFKKFSCWAIPVKKAVNVLPAEAQYQIVSSENSVFPKMLLPQYSSITIFPFLRIINPLVLFSERKAFRFSISEIFQLKFSGEVVSHKLELVGGKYNSEVSSTTRFISGSLSVIGVSDSELQLINIKGINKKKTSLFRKPF